VSREQSGEMHISADFLSIWPKILCDEKRLGKHVLLPHHGGAPQLDKKSAKASSLAL
jgi:hypothetical protein